MKCNYVMELWKLLYSTLPMKMSWLLFFLVLFAPGEAQGNVPQPETDREEVF